MEVFKGQNLLEFAECFKTDEDCKKYLSDLKWKEGFLCRKCGHTASQIRKDFSRTCNICSHTESSSANTLFHKCKFGLRKAFFICFEMATTTKSLSALQMSVRYGVQENTARLFMHKVRESMKSSENHPMDGIVHVDEFVVGGHEETKQGRSYDSKKKKAVCALELTEDGKVKRFYILKIKDFSSKSLRQIFDKHIEKEAKITTDKWKGYAPISEEYNITQILSKNGSNFKALHTMIHQVKTWIRTTHSWVSDGNIQRYFNEFCYRINRSQNKESIFHNLINKMVKADKINQKELVCS
ncbi:IS1595 family transposase [Flavobacterium columnare]|uniref:IS1595 family transposase n=1 Tax=Flavobacterium columnare TaxID=996 RepID=UPI002D214207|nr:IS1595 family transposase [Flavobacterium columnare]MEB3801986.1 IS1595 family transposase [Flavobacterium columnare]